MGVGTNQARPNLDEIRRDLFHAEGDKVCAGRLIHRHAPALLDEVERLRDERTLTLNMDHLATLARLQEEIERLRDGIRRLDAAVDRHHWAIEHGHDNEPELGDESARALRDLVALLDEDNTNG